MSKVLIVIGTSDFDVHELCAALKERGVECVDRLLSNLIDPPGHYDLAALFGLTGNRQTAYMYAEIVRKSIGPKTKLLVVSSWSRSEMAEVMKEQYDAEYEVRGSHVRDQVHLVLKMLNQAKTAP